MDLVMVGNITMDIIQLVSQFPQENTKGRVLKQSYAVGGNAANAIRIASQLGLKASWIGTLPLTDPWLTKVQTTMSNLHINMTQSVSMPGVMPVSWILLSQKTGSRTILHHRELSELRLEDFIHQMKTLHDCKWMHFEGRNLNAVSEMMKISRKYFPQMPLSVEIEAPRYAWNCIVPVVEQATIVFFSREYVTTHGATEDPVGALNFLTSIVQPHQWFIVPWGEDGAYVLCGATHQHLHVPIPKSITVVDSIGAGDTLIGATLAAYIQGCTVPDSVAIAVSIATLKCKQSGLTLSPNIIASFHENVGTQS